MSQNLPKGQTIRNVVGRGEGNFGAAERARARNLAPLRMRLIVQRLASEPDNKQTFRPVRGTQSEHISKPLKHSIVKRVLAFKR